MRETKSQGKKTFARQFSDGFRLRDNNKRRSTPKFRALSSLSLSRARAEENKDDARQKQENRNNDDDAFVKIKRAPSAPYKAKCHSKISSSKGSAHVANAFGSASSCASASANSFISCEMRRTAALFDEGAEEAIAFVSCSLSFYASLSLFGFDPRASSKMERRL